MPEVDKLILEMNCHDDYAINGINKEAQIFWYIVNNIDHQLLMELIINYLTD